MKEDWIECDLGNVCFTTSGGTPNRQNKSFYEGNIPWVKSGELDKGIILDSQEHISEDAIKNSSAKIFPKGTLLFALYGATIGKMATLGIAAATNQAICGIYENDVLISKYLYHYLSYKKRELIGKGIGGAQPNISQTILKQLLISIAPLPEQRAIVSKIEELFSDLDKGIENLKKAKDQLVIYRQAVLKKAFEGELTKEWREKQINLPAADELIEQIKAEREKHYKQQIEDWKKEVKVWEINWKKASKPSKPQNLVSYPEIEQNKYLPILNLGELVSQISIKLMPDDAPEMPFIGMDCIEKNALKPHFTYKFNEFKSAGNWFNINHILYGRMRPYLNKVYHAEYEGVASGEFIVLETTESILPEYLKLILHQQDFVHWSNRQSSGDKPRVKFEQIALYNIIVPTVQEQHQIVKEIESRLSVCDKVEQSINDSLEKAKALRQSILKKAFEGKLLSASEIANCKQEKDYEPASVLLAKIKAEKKKKK
jgi:type I restriction enzyme S subunit